MKVGGKRILIIRRAGLWRAAPAESSATHGVEVELLDVKG